MPVIFACTWFDKMVGLLKQDVCKNGETLLIAPCSSIHTFKMKHPIDIAFVDRWGCVVKSIEALSPGKIVFCKKAVCVLERRSQDVRRSKTDRDKDGLRQTEWYVEGEYVSLQRPRRKGE